MIFKDKYFFLSTFFISPFKLIIDGKECDFICVEAAYQAQKVPEIADKFSQIKGLEAKRMEGHLRITRDNWEDYSLYAMANALQGKFSNRILYAQLCSIKGDIVHDNYWGDEYWGVSKGKGKNLLGKMLMCLRDNQNDLQILYDYITNELLEESKS